MIPIKQLKELSQTELDGLFNRFGEDFSSIMIRDVIPIVTAVQKKGDRAVKEYTMKFDGVQIDSVMATEEEIENAYRNTSEKVLDAFKMARDNVWEFHTHQKRDSIIYTREDGTTLGMMYQPIEKVGIYVPGGKASYPSSVVMGVVPAQIAGASEITVITPPDENGGVPHTIGAVCHVLGVKNILKSGGAQGIAAAGFGTETVPAADIIVGPGNIYVTAAKTYLFSLGVIQIDSMAGPSEVLVIADESANPEWVTTDLLSQAEHEERAIAVLITTSPDLAEKVQQGITRDIESGSGRHQIKKTSIENSGLILLADSLEECIEFSNRYGPEHMELIVHNPLEHLTSIKNVGSLFLGGHAPVAVGDYYSGTNHVLPTGGAARYSSGLGVETFLRRTSFQFLTEGALKKSKEYITTMAEVEGFDDKHGGSVRIRFDPGK